MLAYFAGDPDAGRAAGPADAGRPRSVGAGDGALGTCRATPENNGDIDTCAPRSPRPMPLFVAVGDRWGQSMALAVRGYLRTLDGDLAGAVEDYRAGAGVHRAARARSRTTLFLRLRLSDVHAAARGLGGGPARRCGRRSVSHAGLSRAADRILFADTELATLTWLDGDLRRRAGRSPTHVRAAARRAAATADSAARPHDRPSSRRRPRRAGRRRRGRLDQARERPASWPTGRPSAPRDQPIMAAVGVAVAWLAAALGRPREPRRVLGARPTSCAAPTTAPTGRRLPADSTGLRAALGADLDAAVAAGAGAGPGGGHRPDRPGRSGGTGSSQYLGQARRR